MRRSSGILMPISSLPSPYGIGTFGKSAYDYADFLHKSGQTYWQLLPLGPTGYGDSPYQSFSTYAGNPYFIDLDFLVQEGLVNKNDLDNTDWGDNQTKVDYGKIYNNRYTFLKQAFEKDYPTKENDVYNFAQENSKWIYDYALYMALKAHFNNKQWTDWGDENIRLRKPEALNHYHNILKSEVNFYIYIQYLFFKQWNKLRDYVKNLNISIIGDIPIYVSMDSSDVWSETKYFMLDQQGKPTKVAGVPPDYFNSNGQLWGNPLYNWDVMAQDNYDWWKRRINGAAKLYDVIRIDHFRGLESYWEVPYGETTAINGKWTKGPDMHFVQTLKDAFPYLEIIAEDLGFLTPEVKELLAHSGFPGMKVLEFAFDSREPSNYLPHTYTNHCVCYVGTHDNETVCAWLENADPSDIELAKLYLGLNHQEGLHWGIIRGGMSSVADLFICQMQDYLALGKESRMNTPGTSENNWQWRMSPFALSEDLADKIKNYTRIYGRLTY